MNRMPAPLPPSARDVAALADQCVMCGLCLPHCPTYRLARTEAESPRGRIALARALATGAIAAQPAALEHLDHCLGCLACQTACPSGVRYEELLVSARARLRARPGWLHNARRLARLARIGAALRADRWLPALGRLLPNGSLWRRLAATLPAVPPQSPSLTLRARPSGRLDRAAAGAARAAKTIRPATAGTGGEPIALFRGCVGDVYERDTLAAARTLLEACGHDVFEPPAFHCCGALARHAGDVAGAAREAESTRWQLLAAGASTAIGCASGCHGDLRDAVARGTPLRVPEVHAFLAQDAGFAALRFRPLALRAALHVPCTQANVAGGSAAIRHLLARIPGLDLIELPAQPRCCGAAGSYFIEQPEIADRLRSEKLDQVAAVAPDLLLTTNVGCRMHLGNGLRGRGGSPRVLHPLALLARQLDNPPP